MGTQTSIVHDKGSSVELYKNLFFPKKFSEELFTFWSIARLQIIYEMSVESSHKHPVSFVHRNLKENISVRDAGLYQSKKG